MERRNKKKVYKISIISAIILMAFSFLAGINYKERQVEKLEIIKDYKTNIVNKYQDEYGDYIKDVNFDLYWQVWDELKNKYVDQDKLNEKDLFYGSLKGMVQSIGDPYTSFLDPDLAKEFNDDMSGSFEGIGAEIGIRKEILTVIAPLPDTPAFNAGIKSGDRIYEINGESTMGITIDEAVNKIRGEKGTEVILTVYRDGFDEPKEINIIRGTIKIDSVKTEYLEEENIFVINIYSFNSDTGIAFNRAIEELRNKNPKGIILDLRNNPGGYLEIAVDIASKWVESGPIVIEKFDEEIEESYMARGIARLKDYNTVVLVDGGSASASEIVAGALQDYGLATIVGTQTFGKGSVQSLSDFSDGSSLKITVAKWLTPKGSYITEVGITPDKVIKYTIEDFENDTDLQLEAGIKVINGEEVISQVDDNDFDEIVENQDNGRKEVGDEIDDNENIE
ncbi:S41 family peptidase [bacterium]|nr:S41 family peptidase [bacterium]